jgi:GTP pyrophosphokinase
LSEGRGIISKELQRAGQTGANIEELSHKLGFARPTICTSLPPAVT